MTKWLQIGFIIAVTFFLFRQIPLFADENKTEGNFLKICAELSNGDTDSKKYIGERISFKYYALNAPKDKKGSATINGFIFSSPEASSYGTKVLILNPSYHMSDPPYNCSITSIVKAVDVASKTIIISQANVCYAYYDMIRA